MRSEQAPAPVREANCPRLQKLCAGYVLMAIPRGSRKTRVPCKRQTPFLNQNTGTGPVVYTDRGLWNAQRVRRRASHRCRRTDSATRDVVVPDRRHGRDPVDRPPPTVRASGRRRATSGRAVRGTPSETARAAQSHLPAGRSLWPVCHDHCAVATTGTALVDDGSVEETVAGWRRSNNNSCRSRGTASLGPGFARRYGGVRAKIKKRDDGKNGI